MSTGATGAAALFKLLLILALVTVPAEARAADVPGTWEESLTWLKANQGSSQFGNVLLASVTAAPDLAELERILGDYLPLVRDRQVRARVLHATGQVFETASRFARAAEWYAEAVREDPGWVTALYDHAVVLLEMGQITEAIPMLTSVINKASDRETQRSAAILRTRAYLMDGNPERALRHARSLTGDVNDARSLFLLYEVARRAGDDSLAEESARQLDEFFSGSPEWNLSRDVPGARITHYPSPTRILGLPAVPNLGDRAQLPTVEPREPIPAPPTEPSRRARDRDQQQLLGIQTGSFRDRENAHYMVRDMGNLGFEAEISPTETDTGTFYRVIIPVGEGDTHDKAQELVIRLKEEGVEGFLVFER